MIKVSRAPAGCCAQLFAPHPKHPHDRRRDVFLDITSGWFPTEEEAVADLLKKQLPKKLKRRRENLEKKRQELCNLETELAYMSLEDGESFPVVPR